MKTLVALTVAALAVAAAAAAPSARPATLAPAHLAAPCPAPPVRYRPVPFNSLSWNWEIGQWVATCAVGRLEGPPRLAAMIHVTSSDPTTIATRYVSVYLARVVLKVPASKAIAERIGLTRVQRLMVAGVLTGFRLRGRP
jgi:hypothetical protein